MKSVWLYCLFLTYLGGAYGQGMTTAQLATLKAATMLVLVETPDGLVSGSGFLMLKDANYGYIATNAHVVQVDPGVVRRVKVVLNSGAPGAERVLLAEVLAQDDSRDIAILRIGADNLPEPLKLATQAPHETMQVFVLGFPFGEMLTTSKLHPAVTITTGTVTSLRLNDFGKVSLVQVDADINEGNSGGPMVDASGGLIGIATEKIEDTKIGLGLPSSDLTEMLRGRIKEVGFHLQSNQDGRAEYRIVAVLIDPLHQVKSVSLFVAPQEQAPQLQPDANGKYGKAAPQMWEFPLQSDGTAFVGPLALQSATHADASFVQQIRIEMADGQFKWTAPARLVVPFSQGTLGAGALPNAGQPLQPVPGTPATLPPNSGQPNHAVPSSDGWLGSGAVPGAGSKTPGGTIVATPSSKMLLGVAQTEGNAVMYPLDLAGGSIVPSMQWSPDGKYLYVLEDKGILHKIAVPTFREEKVLQFGQAAKYMALSRNGLVVGLPLLQEVWVIATDTLTLVKRITVPGITGLATAPVLSLAIISHEGGVSVLNLSAGQIAAQEPIAARFPRVTPDGQYLIFEDAECLHRYRLNGTALVHEEDGPRIGQNSQNVEISADSIYVALPSGGGNYNDDTPGHPHIGPYATYIYRVTDLHTPVMVVASGAYPCALAFDKAAAKVYAQNVDNPLMVFNPAGIKESAYNLRIRRGYQVRQMLPHPDGHKVLVLAGDNLVWVQLPSANPAP